MGAECFRRADGVELRVVPGFRERVLAMRRTAVRPTGAWGDEEFARAAVERIRRIDKVLKRARRGGIELRRARLLEIGCGPGIDALIAAARAPVSEVVGIDLDLPLFDPGPSGDLPRRLAKAVCAELGLPGDLDAALSALPLRLTRANAAAMPFADASFDFCWSDAVLEHVSPIDTCLEEMARVLRPSARAIHKVDPYFWVKGCHRRGLIDLPWAHARLSVPEVVQAARRLHGAAFASRARSRLNELNRLTTSAWREVFEAAPLAVADWQTVTSEFARELLVEFPEVQDTLLPGVAPADLTESTIQVELVA